MDKLLILVSGLLAVGVIVKALRVFISTRVSRRAKWIERYVFPESIAKKICEHYPQLTEAQVGEVIHGLREYFQVCNLAGNDMVSMPSQAIDAAWHEFILFTRQYESFCRRAFGRFLHHTPAEAMRLPTRAQEGIKVAWERSCQREGIRPHAPNKVPILFAMDTQLQIPDGFHYSLDCTKTERDDFCASHIGCTTDYRAWSRADPDTGFNACGAD